MVLELLNENRKLIFFLKEQRHPFTTDQIANRLDVPTQNVCKTLGRMQSLGLLTIEFISPGYSIVIPRCRFLSMAEQELDSLCEKVTNMDNNGHS